MLAKLHGWRPVRQCSGKRKVVSAAVAALRVGRKWSLAHAAIVTDVDNVVLLPAATTTYSACNATGPSTSVQIFQT